MGMKLRQSFYSCSAEELAPRLLGKLLCRKIDGIVLRYRITETEAYMAFDTACHAHRGKTNRNAVMFEQGGVAYVYLCYGIHNLLNVVSGEENSPQAVLIRGVENYNGPGKLTKILQIDRTLNGIDLTGDTLWIEDDGVTADYTTTPRIGINYADEADKLRLWRFVCK